MDNYTVRIMLGEVLAGSNNPFVDSLAGYARYWHGYLVFLKPLMVFLDLKQIRICLQTLLVLALVVLSIVLSRKYRKLGTAAALSIAISYGIFAIIDASAALPLFPSFVISLLGSLAVAMTRRINMPIIVILFFLIGAFDVYFDFLDNPILTLGVPLLVLVLRINYGSDEISEKEADRSSCKKMMKAMISAILLACLGWVIGYAYLWILKWVLSTLVTGVDVISDAMRQAEYGSGVSESEGYTLHAAIKAAFINNLNSAGFRIKILIALAVLVIMLIIVMSILTKIEKRRSRATLDENNPYVHHENLKPPFPVLLSLLFVSALPYMWYAVFSNHSYIHSGIISFRNQALTMVCLLVMLYICCDYARRLIEQMRR